MPTFEHGSAARVFVAGFDLSPYLKSVSVDGSVDTADSSALGNTAKAYIPGLEDATLSAEGMWEGSSTNVAAALEAAKRTFGPVVYTPAGADTIGDRGQGLDACQTSHALTSSVDEINKLSVEFQSRVGAEPLTVAMPYAVYPAPGATTALASIDGLAASANWVVYTVITAVNNAGGAPTIRIQDSADDVTFVTKSSNTAPAVGVYRVTGTDGLLRYVREQYTVPTSSSITVLHLYGRQPANL